MARNSCTHVANSSHDSMRWLATKRRNVSERATETVISRFSFMPEEPSPLNSQNLTE